VPNIKSVQKLSILDIAREMHRLTVDARSGHLSQHDLSGGTLTVSNIGAIGGTYAHPLVNVPEVAIVALGRCEIALPSNRLFCCTEEAVEEAAAAPNCLLLLSVMRWLMQILCHDVVLMSTRRLPLLDVAPKGAWPCCAHSSMIYASDKKAGVSVDRVRMVADVGRAGQIEMIPKMAVSWGADHRVIDGATLAAFSNTWKSYLESRAALLLALA
jgi:pyruvate/2-oxoglutarate dehydrogenase complex dihydrolipoamide acyltransferase (E2) component